MEEKETVCFPLHRFLASMQYMIQKGQKSLYLATEMGYMKAGKSA
jgi:hypothetical protein